MVLTQLGQIVMMTTDLVFIGRIGSETVAAAALASRVYLVSFTFGAGLLSAIVPLVAQAFGTNDLAMARCALRMGLWTSLLLSLPIMAFALGGEHVLLAFGQAPKLAFLAQQYLIGVAWGVGPALSFLAIRSFMSAVNRPEPVLWITLGAIPTNALLVYLLVFGKLGLPSLELFGAGLATTIVNCGTCLASLWFAATRHPFRDYRILAQIWRFDWRVMRQLIAIGTPSSLSSLTGYGIISVAALLAGAISTNALAAHQIAVQVSAILLMIPFSISMAATVRVGHAVGRGDGTGVKWAGVVALVLGVLVAVTLTVFVIVARFEIAELFLGKSDDAEATMRLTARLLLMGGVFFITDAVATIAAGSLRGLGDTRVPFVLSTVAYWLVGFSLSYVLSLKIGLALIGIWIGLSIGSTVDAGLLVLRFQLLASRRVLQGRC
nr:MATE family efflux transporter [Bradyrhizobium manausense]